MAGIFLFLYDVFKRYRFAFFSAIAIIALVAGFTGSRISLEEDISKAMPADEKTEKLNEVFQNSRFLDKLIVYLTLEDANVTDPEQLSLFADSLISHLREQYSPRYIREITGITSDDLMQEVYDSLYQNLPLYLAPEDYDAISRSLSDSAIDQTLRNDYMLLLSPASMVMKPDSAGSSRRTANSVRASFNSGPGPSRLDGSSGSRAGNSAAF